MKGNCFINNEIGSHVCECVCMSEIVVRVCV